MIAISFDVPGTPQTKGSARAFVVKGRAVVTNDNARTKSWAGVVATFALAAMQLGKPLEGPVRVTLRFRLARPKAHYRKGGLRGDAPSYVSKRPDVDKLARAVLDALTSVCFVDDAQVAALVVEKFYGERPGVSVHVEAIGATT